MVLNKTIKNEVARAVYEERMFGVHVHQGVNKGGIECISTGRQPLQYKFDKDMRFDRFAGIEEFGFHRLKKLHITIFHEEASEATHRHIALNTYYMNHAICLLLKRDIADSLDAKCITSITIDFVPSPKPMGTGNVWKDPNTDLPRITSIHGVSDIELVLRPFALLTGVHNVTIELPNEVANHAPTVTFVEKLKASMRSIEGSMFNSDDLDHKIEVAKEALHDYILKQLYGGKFAIDIGVDRIVEEEFMEDMQDEADAGRSDFDFDGSDYEQEEVDFDPRNDDYGHWLEKMEDEQAEYKKAIEEAELAIKRAEAYEEAKFLLEAMLEKKENCYTTTELAEIEDPDPGMPIFTSDEEVKLDELMNTVGDEGVKSIKKKREEQKAQRAMQKRRDYTEQRIELVKAGETYSTLSALAKPFTSDTDLFESDFNLDSDDGEDTREKKRKALIAYRKAKGMLASYSPINKWQEFTNKQARPHQNKKKKRKSTLTPSATGLNAPQRTAKRKVARGSPYGSSRASNPQSLAKHDEARPFLDALTLTTTDDGEDGEDGGVALPAYVEDDIAMYTVAENDVDTTTTTAAAAAVTDKQAAKVSRKARWKLFSQLVSPEHHNAAMVSMLGVGFEEYDAFGYENSGFHYSQDNNYEDDDGP